MTPQRRESVVLSALVVAVLAPILGMMLFFEGCSRVCDAGACAAVVRFDMRPYLVGNVLPSGAMVRACVGARCEEALIGQATERTAGSAATPRRTVSPDDSSIGVIAVGQHEDPKSPTLAITDQNGVQLLAAEIAPLRLTKVVKENFNGPGCPEDCWSAKLQLSADGHLIRK